MLAELMDVSVPPIKGKAISATTQHVRLGFEIDRTLHLQLTALKVSCKVPLSTLGCTLVGRCRTRAVRWCGGYPCICAGSACAAASSAAVLGEVSRRTGQAVARMCTPRVAPGQRAPQAAQDAALFRGPAVAAAVDLLRVHLPPLLLLPDEVMEGDTPRDYLLNPQVRPFTTSGSARGLGLMRACGCPASTESRVRWQHSSQALVRMRPPLASWASQHRLH